MMRPKQAIAHTTLCMLWGSSWIASGTAASTLPPLLTGALQFALAAAFLLPVIAFQRLRLPRRRDLLAPLLLSASVLSVSMMALPFALLAWAAPRAGPGNTVLLLAATPLLAALLTAFLERRSGGVSQTALQWLLVGSGAVGLVVSGAVSVQLGQLPADIAVLLAAVLLAGSSVYGKRALRSVHPTMAVALQAGGAALLLGLASLALEHTWPAAWSGNAIGSLLFLGLTSGVGFSLYYSLLKYLAAFQIGTVQWILPLVAITEAALLARQSIPALIVSAYVLTLGCAVILLRGPTGSEEPLSLGVTRK